MGIKSDFPLENVRIGDSIAVCGACLTVVAIQDRLFRVDVAPETLSKSSMGQLKVGDRVNLERALRLGDRLDGHLVTGHIDGMGKITGKRPAGNAILFSFAVGQNLSRHIVKKGSVAVEGISLTVNTCDEKGFEVSIIPHTAAITTLGLKKVGDEVNIETDLIGKYVERFTHKAIGTGSSEKAD